jgi:hypothetical protein
MSLTTSAGTMSCSLGSLSGFQSTTATIQLTVSPSFSGCTFLGIFGVAVNPNGCDFVLLSFGIMEINCFTATYMTFSAVGCVIKIGSQSGLSNVSYSNIGSGTTTELTVGYQVTNIKYHTGEGCPGGTVNGTTGGLSGGDVDIRAIKSGAHAGILRS